MLLAFFCTGHRKLLKQILDLSRSVTLSTLGFIGTILCLLFLIDRVLRQFFGFPNSFVRAAIRFSAATSFSLSLAPLLASRSCSALRLTLRS